MARDYKRERIFTTIEMERVEDYICNGMCIPYYLEMRQHEGHHSLQIVDEFMKPL